LCRPDDRAGVHRRPGRFKSALAGAAASFNADKSIAPAAVIMTIAFLIGMATVSFARRVTPPIAG
jgi:hypothetical protein